MVGGGRSSHRYRGETRLSWGASCLEGDRDYAVYEGVLGDYTTHDRRVCSTARRRVATFDLPASDRYYLVVSRNGTHEGSYGRDGNGERPTGLLPCLPQAIDPCPFP